MPSLFSLFSSAPSKPAPTPAGPDAPASGVATADAAQAPGAGGPVGIHDVFVARQPIFDAQDRLFAYELLYRSGSQQNWANGVSSNQMCTDTVIHALLSIGMSPLTGGTLAFVNMTRDFLLSGQYQLFEPATVVIELLETVEPDPKVVTACKHVVRAG